MSCLLNFRGFILMSATLLDLDDVLTSDRLENSTTVANEKKQMVIGVKLKST